MPPATCSPNAYFDEIHKQCRLCDCQHDQERCAHFCEGNKQEGIPVCSQAIKNGYIYVNEESRSTNQFGEPYLQYFLRPSVTDNV